VRNVPPEVMRVANAMVNIPALPYVHIETQVFLDSIREPTLHELHRSFQSDPGRSQKQVDMVRHHNKFMQEEFSFITVSKDGVEEQICHAVGLEQRAMAPCTGGHEVASVPNEVQSRGGFDMIPQRLKPSIFGAVSGTAEAVPSRHSQQIRWAVCDR
jgi:hypothetical protein